MPNDVEASRISDVDRDSKSLRERSKLVRSRKAMNKPRQGLSEAYLDLHQNGRVVSRANHGGICERFDFENHLGSRTEFCGSNEHPFKQSNHHNRNVAITNIEKLPTFNGYSVKLDFLDWFDMFEDYFGAVNPPDVVMCKLAASKLRGEARIWWNELQNNRLSQGKSLITSWSRMRELLLKRFLHTSRLTWWYKEENEVDEKPFNCSMKGLLGAYGNDTNNVCELVGDLCHTAEISLGEVSNKDNEYSKERNEEAKMVDHAEQEEAEMIGFPHRTMHNRSSESVLSDSYKSPVENKHTAVEATNTSDGKEKEILKEAEKNDEPIFEENKVSDSECLKENEEDSSDFSLSLNRVPIFQLRKVICSQVMSSDSETLMLESLTDGLIGSGSCITSRIGNELGVKIHEVEREQNRWETLWSSDDVDIPVDEMLTLSFDPGGVTKRGNTFFPVISMVESADLSSPEVKKQKTIFSYVAKDKSQMNEVLRTAGSIYRMHNDALRLGLYQQMIEPWVVVDKGQLPKFGFDCTAGKELKCHIMRWLFGYENRSMCVWELQSHRYVKSICEYTDLVISFSSVGITIHCLDHSLGRRREVQYVVLWCYIQGFASFLFDHGGEFRPARTWSNKLRVECIFTNDAERTIWVGDLAIRNQNRPDKTFEPVVHLLVSTLKAFTFWLRLMHMMFMSAFDFHLPVVEGVISLTLGVCSEATVKLIPELIRVIVLRAYSVGGFGKSPKLFDQLVNHMCHGTGSVDCYIAGGRTKLYSVESVSQSMITTNHIVFGKNALLVVIGETKQGYVSWTNLLDVFITALTSGWLVKGIPVGAEIKQREEIWSNDMSIQVRMDIVLKLWKPILEMMLKFVIKLSLMYGIKCTASSCVQESEWCCGIEYIYDRMEVLFDQLTRVGSLYNFDASHLGLALPCSISFMSYEATSGILFGDMIQFKAEGTKEGCVPVYITFDPGGHLSIHAFQDQLLFPFHPGENSICLSYGYRGYHRFITRGRVIPREAWNDGNKSNMYLMAKLFVTICNTCLMVVDKNGQIKRTMRLFRAVVNGLDPPTDVVVSLEVSMCYTRLQQWLRSWTSFLRKGDGMM